MEPEKLLSRSIHCASLILLYPRICTLQAFLQWLHSWSHLVGEQGLISVELSAGQSSSFPGAAVSDLWTMWRQVFCLQPCRDLTTPSILAAAAAAGLVPRPSTGLRFCRSPTSQPLLPRKLNFDLSCCVLWLLNPRSVCFTSKGR